jgi:hypothetical protein
MPRRLAAAERVEEAFSLWKDNAEDISKVLIKSVGTKGITKKKIVGICTITLVHLGYQVIRGK